MTPQRLAQIQSDFYNSEAWTPDVVGELLIYIRQLRAEVGGGHTATTQMQQLIDHLKNDTPKWQEKPTSAGLWVYVVNPEAESHPGILVRVYKEQIATGITTNFTPVYGPIPEFNSKETK